MSKNSRLIMQSARQFSLWGSIEAAPADPILGINDAFKKSTIPNK